MILLKVLAVIYNEMGGFQKHSESFDQKTSPGNMIKEVTQFYLYVYMYPADTSLKPNFFGSHV